MSDNQLLEVIEKYLNGEMTGEELACFEVLRNGNEEINGLIAEHKQFTGLIKQYGERLELEKRLDAIHEEIDVHALKDELMIHPSWIVQLWRNHHSKISVAASIAIFATLTTLFFSGYFNNRDLNYVQLKDKINTINIKTKILDGKINALTPPRKTIVNPGKYRGTGFAISSNGYIVTDFHVINGADSVYVQNAAGESFHAKVIHTDPIHDIAVLEINDPSFKNLGAIPYSFKKAESDIGENVFTMGYPRDAMVLGAGYLSATTGFNSDNSNDSTTYQVSIPVNFGNSGGPLVDNKGNIIGIVNAKETHIAGAAFAIKSSYLLKAIQDIPSDSLKHTLNMNSKSVLAGLSRAQQFKKMLNYVFMVRVYNQ